MIIATVMGTAISSVGMYSSGPTRSFLIWVSFDENIRNNNYDIIILKQEYLGEFW